MDNLIKNYEQVGGSQIRDTPYTHVILPLEKRLFVDEKQSADFIIDVCDLVQQGLPHRIYENLERKRLSQLSLYVVLEYESSYIDMSRNHVANTFNHQNDDIITYLISSIQRHIKHISQLSPNGNELFACVLQPDTDFVLKDGFYRCHYQIIFPYAKFLLPHLALFQEDFINSSRLGFSEFLSQRPFKIHNRLDTIIQFPSNNLRLIYGGTGGPADDIYLATHSYGDLTESHHIEVSLEDIFNLEHHPVLNSNQSESENDIYYWLPAFFSCDYYSSELELDPRWLELSVPRSETRRVRSSGLEQRSQRERERKRIDYNDENSKVLKLTGMISREYAQVFWAWEDIGRAIHWCDRSPEGVAIWKFFTSLGRHFTDADCDNKWLEFEESFYNSHKNSGYGRITINTLEWYAKLSNPGEYENYRWEQLEPLLFNAISNPTVDVPLAIFFARSSIFDFRCGKDPDGKTCWYAFNQHYWYPCDETDIQHYFNYDFIKMLEMKQKEFADVVAQTFDPQEKINNQNYLAKISTVLTKLNKDSYQKQVLRAAIVHLKGLDSHRKESILHSFNRFADSQNDLFGCPNGVLDLRNKKPFFRPGKPEDYITRVGAIYRTDYHEGHPDIIKGRKYLRTLFPDDKEEKCFRAFSSARLRGENHDRYFVIIYGRKRNGKSQLVKVLTSAWGSYFGKVPTTLFTNERIDSSKPDPLMKSTYIKRYVITDEPSKTETVKEGLLKSVTGRDTQVFRDCHAGSTGVMTEEVKWGVAFICNDPPVINDTQEAIWDRGLLFKLVSMFVRPRDLVDENGYPLSEAEQHRRKIYPENTDFDNEIPTLARALLWIFVQDHEDYRTNGIPVPESILQDVENHRQKCNLFAEFLRTCAERKYEVTQELDQYGQYCRRVDDSIYTTINELYNRFVEWYGKQPGGKRPPEKAIFLKEITSLVGTSVTQDEKGENILRGFCLVNNRPSGSSASGLNGLFL